MRSEQLNLANQSSLCICDGNLHLDTRLDADAGDLLDNLRWAVKVNETLMDPHLEPVPGFGTLSARGLTGGDAQGLRKQDMTESEYTWPCP